MTDNKGFLETLYYQNKINNYVIVSASPCWDNKEYNSVQNLLNWNVDNTKRYFSNPTTNPYILFQFIHEIPFFTSYSIQTHNSNSQSFPTYWGVEGSNSAGGPWEFLDRRNENTLAGYNRKVTFRMKTTNYKYIKFTQYSNYYENPFANTFAVRKIEFYPLIKPKITVHCKNQFIKTSILLYVTIQFK